MLEAMGGSALCKSRGVGEIADADSLIAMTSLG